ncbi:TPA: UDP-N-acetylglucosamine--undecaprenyl-phosphate N-acetylglucosaminephosphotransferase [Vibrio parahaemolyticus]|uniref:UDP-N-acetylglucosamine--undecaprenyl-phosphate N-acetylglucosaminephosphotransferase n=2 Tax=Vibrio parahaemolyticus TaxID=670 RepID=UPI000A3AFE5C|nr:UDP-N-acetylglucosamine--undecaprenyl-phosphate N-acetylglucosaminephosphotransferase [Vibrio parahaemolyticus]EGQ7766531.1 UDP-N-acetylglucosamine--undecaprenyl-phosphate N-acetylglucosaminephosphotransferase [Vibrio parahaemolyticus]EGQ7781298.1 UDP-N-acetylglucosamine--undecaprenyl-phosphate N-acetylglucosaminephosphotransferase [Vibrio parahaemolyticus]EGQ9520100.1 UDP-N-acetylglucosamine--undecaprenyl-phosphate N-acetylglucosaminephosphotransferase [Vibrio parahaemolyticus]EIV1637128.1 
MFLELSFIFFSSFATLFLMRKVAKHIGLVDKPNARKLHNGAVPLVGGISICLVLAQYLTFNPDTIEHSWLYLLCICVLTIVGAVDDKIDLSFKVRMGVQAALSVIMMKVAGIELHSLGNMFGIGDISLGWSGSLITILAVIGAINAFNMVDGIDGLLGGLSIVTFGAMAFLLQVDSQHGLAYLCVVIIVAMLPYIFMNLGILGRERKVFMGDAGSMMIGFTVIWLLLGVSQAERSEPLMRPVTALWLIAVPLMDMTAIMIRRIRRGDSPFKPDREHLHHIFQRLGLGPRQTLVAICLIATLYASFGIYGEIKAIPEVTMFTLFICCFIIYSFTLSYIWIITTFLRKKIDNFNKKHFKTSKQ